MRKLQVMIASALLIGTGWQGFAQESDKNKDERERLNREMTLEREYDPIVQDATKITTQPAIREMNITKQPISYSEYAVPMFPDKEISSLPPGKLMTTVDHSKRNGYLHFGGGMLWNLMGDFGYHLLNTEADRLGIYFSHRSTNGKVEYEYPRGDPAEIEKRKNKFNDNLGGLDYKHHFRDAVLALGGKFGYSAFNYYGEPQYNYYNDPSFNNDFETNQGNRLINGYGSISSGNDFSLGYHFGIDYTNFDQKYTLNKKKGMTENHIAVDLGLSSPANNGKYFGADLKANLLSYVEPEPVYPSGNDFFINDSAFKTHINATFNPYYRIERGRFKLLLGLNLMLVSQNSETNMFVSPNITLDAPFAHWSLFYAKLGGGIASNSMAELSRINRYVNPAYTADASKTWADLRLGVSSTPAAGFWFDIFGGFKYSESDVFFNPSINPWIDNGYNSVSMIFQPTSQRLQAGVELKYDYQKIVDFYLKGVYDYYTLKNVGDNWKNRNVCPGLDENSKLKPYGKPTFTANAGINVRPVKPLTLSLDYCMMSGIYARIYYRTPISSSMSSTPKDVKMKAVNDLRFRTSWKFNDMFSIYIQANNLLFQKQQLYYGYPLQPFSAMAGFNINF